MWRAIAREKTRCALVSVAALCLSAVLLSGCGVAGRAGAAPPASRVTITEKDFKISAPKQVAAGDVRLSVHNEGPDAHELIVVRGRSGPLPFRSDGLTIDEDRLESSEAGSLEPGAPESVRTLNVHLKPGEYYLFCNMSGHYLGGMHTEIEVE
jgi:uncharacterized cupredoxin-like copper-binding protein